jgi:hypothetical protein
VLDFDQSRCWQDLEAHLERTQSPRQRRLLQVVIDHVKAEVDRNLDGLMATLVAEPNYHFWVRGKDVGPKGHDAVRSYYEAFVLGGGAVFESIKDRIVVDDQTVAHESRMRNLVSGAIAKARGYDVPDETGHYLVRFRNVVWWSFDEAGLALGEDSYTAMDPDDWERVADHDLPQCYVDYLAEIGKLDVVTGASGR